MSSKKSSKRSAEGESNLDLANMGRSIWLMKVPKYIDDLWKSAPSNIEVAKMKIIKDNKSKISEIQLDLTDSILASDTAKKIPKHHKVSYKTPKFEKIGVFSELSDPSSGEKKLALEGCVATKLEVRPAETEKYMALKFESIRTAAKCRKPVQILDRVVNNYKPVSDHKHNIEYAQKKKSEGPKLRADKQVVLDMLFEAFEKHQFYNFKDLVKITQQPVPHLKEILKEIGNFNSKPPHKNMWELKPEFRHYDKKEDNEGSD